MNIKRTISKHTAGIRYWFMYNLIGLVTPTLDHQLKQRERVWFLPRPMILMLKKHFDDEELTGAKIGVERGLNATSILDELNIESIVNNLNNLFQGISL